MERHSEVWFLIPLMPSTSIDGTMTGQPCDLCTMTCWGVMSCACAIVLLSKPQY